MSFSLRKTQPIEFENLYMLLEMQQPQRNFYTEILNKEVFDISPPHHLGTDKQDVVARLNAENGQLRAAQNDKCNPTERCSPKRKVGEISNSSYWNTERQQMSTTLHESIKINFSFIYLFFKIQEVCRFAYYYYTSSFHYYHHHNHYHYNYAISHQHHVF